MVDSVDVGGALRVPHRTLGALRMFGQLQVLLMRQFQLLERLAAKGWRAGHGGGGWHALLRTAVEYFVFGSLSDQLEPQSRRGASGIWTWDQTSRDSSANSACHEQTGHVASSRTLTTDQLPSANKTTTMGALTLRQ